MGFLDIFSGGNNQVTAQPGVMMAQPQAMTRAEPNPTSGFDPFGEMSSLQKMGLVLMSANDPNAIPRFSMMAEQRQQKAEEKDRQTKLADYAAQSGLPPQMVGAIKADPTLAEPFLKQYMNQQMERQDPLYKMRMAAAQEGLNATRTGNQRDSNLAKLFENPNMPAQVLPPDQFGPAAPGRPMTPEEITGKAAAIDPDKYGKSYLSMIGGDAENLPAAIIESREYEKMTPEQQARHLALKRAQPDEVLERKLAEKGAGRYDALETNRSTVDSFIGNLDIARDALERATLTGPIGGRIGEAANDPAYKDWVGAQNTLALQAKTLLGMPNAGFSDADLGFLQDVVGGKFAQKGGATRALDRLYQMANKANANILKNQRDILSRETYNPASLPAGAPPAGGGAVFLGFEEDK